MEETLFSRNRDEAGGREPRIDRLFADAVERQMVEQRSFNRVVEDVGTRLASLESGLRSLWETTSSQGLTLRAELQDGLARMAEDVDSRARALADEVERLRMSSADHAASLGELAHSAEQAIGALGEGQARLAEELVGFQRNLAASTEQTASIPDLVAPQLHRLEQIVSEVEGHVRRALDSGIRELDERVANHGGSGRQLEDMADRLDEQLSALSHRLGVIEQRVDSQGESVEQATSAVARRVAEAHDELRETVTDLLSRAHDDVVVGRLDGLSAFVDERLGRLGEELEAADRRRAEDAADAAQAMRAALYEHIHAVEARLDERFSGLGYGIDERLAELASVMAERVGGQLDAARDAVDESRVALAREIVNLSTRVRQALTALGEATTRDAADTRDGVAVAADHLREVAARVATLEKHVAAIAETPGRTASAAIEVLGPFLEDFRSTLVGEQREELAVALGQVRAVTSGVFEEVEELQVLATTLRQAQTGDEERLVTLRSDLLGQVEGLLGNGLGDIRNAVDQWLGAAEEEGRVVRSAMEERLDAADESFQTAVAKLDDLAPDLDARVSRALDRAIEAARREARTSVGELQSASARLAEVHATLTGLEGSLVASLEAFDAGLEQERVRVIAELLEQFADGLSRRERRRLAGRLSSAREAITHREVASSAPSSARAHVPSEAKPEPSMRPGLLAELLGEQPDQAKPDSAARELAAAGVAEEPADEERTEEARPASRRRRGTPAEAPRAKRSTRAAQPQASTSATGTAESAAFVCPTCGFVARSAAGLGSHRRRHA